MKNQTKLISRSVLDFFNQLSKEVAMLKSLCFELKNDTPAK